MTALHFQHRPLIMGIVNITRDSFSGDGLLQSEVYAEAAVEQIGQMIHDGADLLDIGGESSRPGATPISSDEEMRHIIPVVELVRKKFGGGPVLAIDTIKASVAEAALKAGADIINDITALRHDPAMAGVVARHGCPVVLMHNRSWAKNVLHDARLGSEYGAPGYGDVIENVKSDFDALIDHARSAGIARDHIILDPGLGFGKTVEQNLTLVREVGRLKELGYPVLLGPSRKSFIGKTLDLPIDERLEGTAAVVAVGAFLGADIMRVHDVKFMARAAKMATVLRDL
jgi:dihydropteroate synthase